MSNWDNLKTSVRAPTAWAIYNRQTGTYIHKSLFAVMSFSAKCFAEQYIHKRNLNPHIYIAVGIEEG